MTNQIVAAIEAGASKFEMPWHRSGADIMEPRNVATNRPYHGINVPTLWATAAVKDYHSGWWGSYKQWQEVGGQVRKGEKASTVVFWKIMEKEAEDPQTGEPVKETYPIARPWSVFNAAQQEGWREPEPPPPEDPARIIEHVREFVANTLADIRHGGDRACYRQAGDYIQMPEMSRFRGTRTSSPTEAYYSTELHELTHWSGHPKRLNRDLSGRFGSETYAFEELIAEIGAAFLCTELKISTVPREDHAAYVKSWLKVLRNDKKAIFTAASLATKAAEFLKSLQEPEQEKAPGES